MQALLEWFGDSDNMVRNLAVLAALTWIVTLLLVPWLIARLPVDYFTRETRHPVYADSLHPVLGWSLATLKNVIGAILIAIGLIMLFTPGQGLATVLVGLMLLNFPGKYKLERRMAEQAGVLHSLNWLRAKFAKPPLEAPSAPIGKDA